MKKIPFFKYQGTGNDFVMIDNRSAIYLTRSDVDQIEQLCNRRFGIGADGLILLQEKTGYDFEMVYFNSDGRESSMCGNGGRCIVAFAQQLGVIRDHCHFWAIDGEHEAFIKSTNWVELKMIDVPSVTQQIDHCFLNTGSPHYVQFVKEVDAVDIISEAHKIRYSERFKAAGTNVNFVEALPDGIKVITYERGVEDETLSCGTGVTAAAIAYYLQHPSPDRQQIKIQAKGGNLEVRFRPIGEGFTDIWLCGPAFQVFEGNIIIDDK